MYIRSNEILIQPPSFITNSYDISVKHNRFAVISSVENLKHVLKKRTPDLTPVKTHMYHDDKEIVTKLSEFKPQNKYAKSPLIKRYTFKRTLSNLNAGGSTLTPPPHRPVQELTMANAITSITSKEHGKVKALEIEIQKHSKDNQVYEQYLTNKLIEFQEVIERTGREVAKCKKDLEELEKSQKKIEKNYEREKKSIAFKQTEQLLSMHMVNGKKKADMDVSEEREYFTLKEQMRKAKRELHEQFIENHERICGIVERKRGYLESVQESKKRQIQDLKDQQEIMFGFLCKNLKEGIDLREDGIRWCIKAIWKMNQAVPISSFPKYLDDISAQFLLVLTKIDLEVEDLEKKLQGYRGQIKEDRPEMSLSKSSYEMIQSVRSRIKLLTQKSRDVSTGKVHIGDTIETNREGNVDRYNDINFIKKAIKELSKTRSQLSLQELKRVIEIHSRESHDKEIGIWHVIKCLFGEKSRDFRKLISSKF